MANWSTEAIAIPRDFFLLHGFVLTPWADGMLTPYRDVIIPASCRIVVFHSLWFFLMSPRRDLSSRCSLKLSVLCSTLVITFCAPLWHKTESVACEVLRSRYLRLFNCPINSSR